MTTVSRLNPDTMPDAGALGYSQITVCEPKKLITLSGQVAWSVEGAVTSDDLGEQTETALKNVRSGLEAAGATPDNITRMRIYVVDFNPAKAEEIAPALGTFFGGQAPCVTMLGVTSLAIPELKIEIEVMAAL